jgi:uncharacterized protein with HEPN domain
MPRHDPLVPLQHMLGCAEEAVELARGRKREDLDNDRMLDLSLTRLLEVIGEAATRVPREDRAKYQSIPWEQITGLRNRLIHGYDSVDTGIVWQIVKTDLPSLVAELKRILSKT